MIPKTSEQLQGKTDWETGLGEKKKALWFNMLGSGFFGFFKYVTFHLHQSSDHQCHLHEHNGMMTCPFQMLKSQLTTFIPKNSVSLCASVVTLQEQKPECL